MLETIFAQETKAEGQWDPVADALREKTDRVGALMIETDDAWAVARRDMGPGPLARITDPHTARLPAMAT